MGEHNSNHVSICVAATQHRGSAQHLRNEVRILLKWHKHDLEVVATTKGTNT